MPLLFGTSKAQHLDDNTPDPFQAEAMETSQRILDVILRYKSPLPKGAPDRTDEGALKFLGLVYRAVKNSEPVRMVLPAFPFKSPNSSVKVLGTLPDKAEDVALAHLNGLCAAIGDVYPPGAVLTIVSDGLVYNDLLGVPDHTVWAYGSSLRQLAQTKGYTHIEFSRLKDLIGVSSLREENDDMAYAASAPSVRLALMHRYGNFNWDAVANESYVNNDENKRLTYCGYLKFLALDLATTYPIGPGRTKSAFKRGVEVIAKTMLRRGEAFAKAVRETYPEHVRLSIHPSTGEDKISINVLPTTNVVTPWHSAVAIQLDGTVRAGPRQIFEDDAALELVHSDGRPSYFRESSPLWTWDTPTPVTIEPIYPCGLLITPTAGPNTLSIEHIDAPKLRHLAEQNSPIILRGFTQSTNRPSFVAAAHTLGTPTPWKFGLVLEVRDRGTSSAGLNNVLSQERMPFHFDGLFKTAPTLLPDGRTALVPQPPRFQFFTAVTPSPPQTGYTLFASSRLLFEYLPQGVGMEMLEGMTWSVRTTSFEGAVIEGLKLVVEHPETGRPCLRFHERWPQEKTRFEPTEVAVQSANVSKSGNGNKSENVSKSGNGTNTKTESQSVCDVIEALLHDRRVCYWHAWEQGDVLVNDNIAMLHTRSEFKAGVDRELWRIHFD